ncbi:MAG: ATP-binding protein [bacterium]|nr:ATP-binding protein [bacterium]
MVKSIELQGSGESLALGREFIHLQLQNAGVSSAISDLVVLACDEACANVVRHFYRDDPEKKYIITINVSPEKKKIIVVVESYGRKIRIRKRRKINLEKHVREGRESGLGIYFMNSLMDEVTYHYIKKMNVVRLIKYISEDEQQNSPVP